MLKRSVKTISIVAALLSMHSVASATCTGSNCYVEPVKFESSYYLSPNHNGIYIQLNSGDTSAIVDLKNVVMRSNGNISGMATSIGNNLVIESSHGASVPVRHVSQTNSGDQLASVKVLQNSKSVTGEVMLEAVSIGNNFGLTLNSTSLAELSVKQCNTGDQMAVTQFQWDPTKLTASATAVGNSISVIGKRN
jgi:hypothetical protein